MRFPVLWSGLCCYSVKCSEILAHIKLLYNRRVNKVFTFTCTSRTFWCFKRRDHWQRLQILPHGYIARHIKISDKVVLKYCKPILEVWNNSPLHDWRGRGECNVLRYSKGYWHEHTEKAREKYTIFSTEILDRLLFNGIYTLVVLCWWCYQ